MNYFHPLTLILFGFSLLIGGYAVWRLRRPGEDWLTLYLRFLFGLMTAMTVLVLGTYSLCWLGIDFGLTANLKRAMAENWWLTLGTPVWTYLSYRMLRK